VTTTAATVPVIRALLDEAVRKRFKGGVLGVSARPDWDGPAEFEHNGVPVRVVSCTSTLAIRDALLGRSHDRWLVILTDCDDADLGLGITAHFVWQRLRRPDPWAAVEDRFGATRIDHRLVVGSGSRDLALGLLAATPPAGWPPAPASLLTRDHALGAVAASALALGTDGNPVDLIEVLRWSTVDSSARGVANLRAVSGDPLVEALLGWIADRCGSVGDAIKAVMREGRTEDLVPLGLVARSVLSTGPGSGPRALLGREAGARLSDQLWIAWATESEAVTRALLTSDQDSAARVLARAEGLLDLVEATQHAVDSPVLRRGLTARLAVLGDALRRAADRALSRAANDADAALVDGALLPAIEQARAHLEEHALAQHPDEVRVPKALAGVRLARWLARPAPATGAGLAGGMARQRDDDAWADRAVTLAWAGVQDEALAQGLRAVIGAARIRRGAHDLSFASALAEHVGRGASAPDGSPYLEDLLSSTALPLAKQQPVLLVVADGMSQSAATEIVDDVVRRYDTWLECLPAGRDSRIAAIAAFPSVTSVCRASLFSGELIVGDQRVEQDGLESLAKSFGLAAKLFHKLTLDTSPGGYALSADVAEAVDDTAGVALVACVLNTIDDALDRSDPGGTAWTADTVKHLRTLLDRARHAGRLVVLTSDHGHIVERRQGRMQPAPGASSNRSRPGIGATPGDGEVRVRGRRVLLHDGDAILAVDERLRYGPLKAGYHGGAAPAEVVIPVTVLASGEAPKGWRLAPPQSPSWWRGPLTKPIEPASAGSSPVPTLFEQAPVDSPAHRVISSAVYRRQRTRAARLAISDTQIEKLLAALLAAPGNRVDAESAASALDVATVQLTGAISQVKRLLNVEQYAVLSLDPDGVTVVLDPTLLAEQFEVSV
jgi:hypothetical protein